MDHEQLAIVGYASGNSDSKKINKELEDVWKDILSDPASLDEVAKILGVSPAEVEAKLNASPFHVKPSEAGFGPVGTAIVAFISAVGWDLAKDIAKDIAKTAFYAIWDQVVKPRVDAKLPVNGFGKETKVFDDTQ